MESLFQNFDWGKINYLSFSVSFQITSREFILGKHTHTHNLDSDYDMYFLVFLNEHVFLS